MRKSQTESGASRGTASPRRLVVVAARKRGWSVGQIAQAAGISTQAVDQHIKKFEAVNGRILERKPFAKRGKAREAGKCLNCGGVFFRKDSRHKRDAFAYCSPKCTMDDNKKIYDGDIKKAIDMRMSRQTWRGIGKALGVPVQTIQRAMWEYLHRSGTLTHNIVWGIWKPTPSEFRRRPKWNWLINRTGHKPL